MKNLLVLALEFALCSWLELCLGWLWFASFSFFIFWNVSHLPMKGSQEFGGVIPPLCCKMVVGGIQGSSGSQTRKRGQKGGSWTLGPPNWHPKSAKNCPRASQSSDAKRPKSGVRAAKTGSRAAPDALRRLRGIFARFWVARWHKLAPISKPKWM